jgi:hypothetical protein
MKRGNNLDIPRESMKIPRRQGRRLAVLGQQAETSDQAEFFGFGCIRAPDCTLSAVALLAAPALEVYGAGTRRARTAYVGNSDHA